MMLQYFTTTHNALLLGLNRGGSLETGIHNTPDDGDCSWQTMGQPVVWLTMDADNRPTADDVAHYQKLGCKSVTLGSPIYGGPVCCSVEVERSRHLMRWQEFLRTTKLMSIGENDECTTGREILKACDTLFPLRTLIGWWISFKPIPLSRVYVPMTRAQLIEGCTSHIEEATDPEAREQWTVQRESFAKLDDDALLVLHDGDARLFERKAA